MVPPRSDRVSRAPPYSRMYGALHVRGYHPLWPAFPCRSASTPHTTGLIHFRSPLLAESPLMSVPPGTEMFQFPGFASCTYVFNARYPIGVGCPIRTPRDQSLLAAPPGFSQRATSFIASWRQGIHQMPFSCSQSPASPASQPSQQKPAMHRNHPRSHPTHHVPNSRANKPQPTANPRQRLRCRHGNILRCRGGNILSCRVLTQHTLTTPLNTAATPAPGHTITTDGMPRVRHPCQHSHGHHKANPKPSRTQRAAKPKATRDVLRIQRRTRT